MKIVLFWVKILVSGGTNSKSGELTRLCGVAVQGISIGTFARKLVSEYIKSDEFDTSIELVQLALPLAKELVDKNLEAISG